MIGTALSTATMGQQITPIQIDVPVCPETKSMMLTTVRITAITMTTVCRTMKRFGFFG